MRTCSSVIPGSKSLAKIPELSKEARRRLKWFDYHQSHGWNVALTCRHFDISRQTFYRWKRRYDPMNLNTLEERSRRPNKVRERSWSPEVVEAVLRLRETYPRWGKDKLVILLRREGYAVSTSKVGRILKHLKERGVLREPARFISARKRARNRPYGIRKPKEYQVSGPGDIVQVDTVDVRPLPAVVLKQFTARDVFSRWDVVEAHRQATASIAATFLDSLEARMPFKVKAVQVDGGSEFMAQFEESCKSRNIKLFVLPPRSPKLNGHVERANRTHTEEFYEVVDSDFTIADVSDKLLEWENTYNTIRPHQSLGYLTPREFLDRYQQNRREEVMCH